MKNRFTFSYKIIPSLFFIVIGIAFYSCKKDKNQTQPCDTPLPDTVSFHADILPVFRSNCSTAGCHTGSNPTGHLNLTDSVAYAQLSKPGSGYINTTTPNHSILYSQMISSSKPMPPSGNLDVCTTNLILKWIEEGAKNN